MNFASWQFSTSDAVVREELLLAMAVGLAAGFWVPLGGGAAASTVVVVWGWWLVVDGGMKAWFCTKA